MARRFTAVIGRLGMPTGDGRIISPGGLTSRDLPLPLSWQRESGEGHEGSVVVARMETVEFHQDMVTATGVMLDVEGAYDAEQLITAGVIGPSMDLDDITYVVDDQGRAIITSARVVGATLVAVPAFAEVSISLDPIPAPGVSRETPGSPFDPATEDCPPVTNYGLTASGDVSRETFPPLEYFTRPAVVGPVTVDGDRVSGYVATWGTCHIGLPGCVTAPSSRTEYAHFLRTEQRTASGESVPVGVLTVGGGHADPELGMVPALAHYDDVGTAVAKVFAGEDEYGIWVSGWVLPYADPVRVAQLSDLDVSGDWRRSGGNLELIAVCAVNTPGFPVLKKVHFSLQRGGQATLIGQFRVEPQDGVSRETPQDDNAARARWRWSNREV